MHDVEKRLAALDKENSELRSSLQRSTEQISQLQKENDTYKDKL